MIFVLGHFNTIEDFELISNKYSANEEILYCGTTSFLPSINKSLPYHPLVHVIKSETTVAEQHAFLDTLLRAIQIEVPTKIIIYNSNMMETATVKSRMLEHCKIVGVPVE
jgi:hypothetical protein